MKYRIILLSCLALLLTACAEEAQPTENTLPTEVPAVTETLPPQTLPAETLPEERIPVLTEPPVTEPPQTIPVETQPSPVWPETPTFASLEEFRPYLYHRIDTGNPEMEFYYTGLPGEVNAETIARMGSLLYVTCFHEENLYRVRGWYYPGDRMVDAYRRGDWKSLSGDEKQALQTAVDMVAAARQESTTELELERALFDMLRSTVTYNEGTTDISDPDNPPRYLTAVGALVDGSANCQGYVDAFAVLASVAGFPNDKMHVDIPSGGHVVNVICVGGSWYVVDATFNDYDDPSGVQVSYRLFNAGVDRCSEYSWDPVMERQPLSRTTDANYYYYGYGDGVFKSFYDLDTMAQSILDDWVQRGLGQRYLMLQNAAASWVSLSEKLNVLANQMGVYISYNIWAESNRQDTFFYIELQ